MSLLTWENNRPQPDEYDPFYQEYIELISSQNVLQALINQGQQIFTIIQKLTEEEASHRYAEGKWSVKEVLGHLIDTERIMAYRALCISRKESASLPGFDQDAYVANAEFGGRSLQNLSTEYDALRNANISLFNSFSEEQLLQKGTANEATVSVRALAYIIAGHERHHLNVLENRYGIDTSVNGSKK